MSDFNIELGNLVRRQNHEMSIWHIVGVGNISTIFKARNDLSAQTANEHEKVWLQNISVRAESIKRTINQYKLEIRELAETYVDDEGNRPEDTSRSRLYIRKLDEILDRVFLLKALGDQIKRIEATKNGNSQRRIPANV